MQSKRKSKVTAMSGSVPRVGATDDFKPITWRGKNLSTDTAIMHYHGRAYSRPMGRGIVLNGLELEPQFDEILDPGDYEIEIRVIRRLPST